jgi:hypothetical protein
MKIVTQQNLDTLIRGSLFFNKINQKNARNFEILFNTIVIYNEEHDTRVLEFIQRLQPVQLTRLVMVQLIDDKISLFWNTDDIPLSMKKGKTIFMSYADGFLEAWKVKESRQIHDLMHIKDRVLINVSLN